MDYKEKRYTKKELNNLKRNLKKYGEEIFTDEWILWQNTLENLIEQSLATLLSDKEIAMKVFREWDNCEEHISIEDYIQRGLDKEAE